MTRHFMPLHCKLTVFSPKPFLLMYSKVFPVKHSQKIWPQKSNISMLQTHFRRKKTSKTNIGIVTTRISENKKTYKTEKRPALRSMPESPAHGAVERQWNYPLRGETRPEPTVHMMQPCKSARFPSSQIAVVLRLTQHVTLSECQSCPVRFSHLQPDGRPMANNGFSRAFDFSHCQQEADFSGNLRAEECPFVQRPAARVSHNFVLVSFWHSGRRSYFTSNREKSGKKHN